MREDSVDSVLELAERNNAWQLRAVCRHYLRNRDYEIMGGGGSNPNDSTLLDRHMPISPAGESSDV